MRVRGGVGGEVWGAHVLMLAEIGSSRLWMTGGCGIYGALVLLSEEGSVREVIEKRMGMCGVNGGGRSSERVVRVCVV